MTGMIIMMVTWVLYKAHQKTNKKFMTQDQKNKMKSVKKSLENIHEAVKKHVETNDLKILALPDYGLILGTTQLLMEEEIIKGAVAEGKQIMVVQPKQPVQENQEKLGEKEFNKPELMNKKPVTFH